MKNLAKPRFGALLEGAASVLDIGGVRVQAPHPTLTDWAALQADYAAICRDGRHVFGSLLDELESDMSDEQNDDAMKRVAPLISGLPTWQQTEIHRIIKSCRQYEVPMPTPEMLAAYDDIIPGGCERLIALVEEQVRHRLDCERRASLSRHAMAEHGQWIAAVLAVMFGVMASFLGYSGHDWLAGSIAVTTISSLAAIFVLGRTTDKDKNT